MRVLYPGRIGIGVLNFGSTPARPEKFVNATIIDHHGFMFEKISVREITGLSWRHCFRKAPFSKKILPSNLNAKPAFWNSSGLKSVSQKPAPFSWRISVDGRPNRRKKAPFPWRIIVDGWPNRRNKAAFSYLTGVLWTEPQSENCGDRSCCTHHSTLLYVDQSDASGWFVRVFRINYSTWLIT